MVEQKRGSHKSQVGIEYQLSYMNLIGNSASQTVTGIDPSCGGNLVGSNNLSCVANLYLSIVLSAVLANSTVSNSGQMSTNGTNVTTLTVTNSTISNNGNESGENGITL